MENFIIYLLETGICLSILFLVYWLFLRRETYFNFNRFYLVGSMVLALTVPLVHLNLMIPEESSWKGTAIGIMKFRNYYQEVILLTNADFGTEPGRRHMQRSGIDGTNGPDEQRTFRGLDQPVRSQSVSGTGDGQYVENFNGKGISLSVMILMIYSAGILFFLSRLIYLIIRLLLLTRRSGFISKDGFRIVEVEKTVSPFSFFKYLFINQSSFNAGELRDVLDHEKAHIQQRHSHDHLFSYMLAIFQWFNPLAWQIRKALKTTHEYIADRFVLQMGSDAADYQSLLLRQVIGYHSEELVNNFNLKPIKNRITMMNKKRSGIRARIKAILLIPSALTVFFLSANFTLNGTQDGTGIPLKDLSGLWINENKDLFSQMIFMEAGRFSFTEHSSVREYFVRPGQNSLILSQYEGGEGISLRCEIHDNEMDLWWNETQRSTYTRSNDRNTMEYYINSLNEKINLPYISQYRLMEREEMIYKLALGFNSQGDKVLLFNGEPVRLNELKNLVSEERNKLSKLDQAGLTAMFFVDQEMPMGEVVRVRDVLREINSLHIADAGYPHGEFPISPLLYHKVAFPRLIPPLDAKSLDKSELESSRIPLCEIDLSARNTTPRALDQKLNQFIGSCGEEGRYVISLSYDEMIPYGQYIETVDMVHKVIYQYRDQLAVKKYQIHYDKLGDDLQREIRHVYPIPLSENLLAN